ncbi:MAG TPA: hypothetical protein DCE03_02850 [Synergistaceae bacterium]|jgi:hypothetical protein|nr:MAG: Uncharacterized protein XD80_0982 [Synergistales bacterium 53_16]KUL03653.1 MAG: Uncharacterized protein XE12_0456 [Synergistales bacterium 54_9]HAA47413.1 hypothetical protein [Synergistaceae bacterium]HAG22675.1 hypothetical protein [Synergistaceae bacterium]
MPLLIVALMLLFVMPWLGLLFLGFFVFLLLLVPLGFAARSLVWLVLGPKELFRVLSNKRVRRNHALEHGTINVIEEKYGIPMMSGLASEEGFTVNGPVSPELALWAAQEALLRIRKGETRLAIHERCGTTIVTVNTLMSVFFILLLIATGSLSIFTVILALAASWILGPYAGRYAQEYMTTSTDLEGVEIAGIERRNHRVRTMGMSVMVPGEIFIRTRVRGEPPKVEVIGV